MKPDEVVRGARPPELRGLSVRDDPLPETYEKARRQLERCERVGEVWVEA